MKKLFFTALVAVVAVGGALSTNATVYQGENGKLYDCAQDETLCSTINTPLRVNGETGDYNITPSTFFISGEEHATAP